MGLLVNGKWVNDWYDTKSTDGNFIRAESFFRDSIGFDKFPAEKNRYHIYISHACPWAHRVSIFRKLKDLEDIIGLTVVDACVNESGWELSEDPINNKQYLHEVYTLANPKYTGRVTVPILWDKKGKTIVNNESSEIIRMLNFDFNDLTGNKLDFYPEEFQAEIDEINEFIYDTINNGVYKVGFATTQEVYNKEFKKLFTALDAIEERLGKQRYLIGNVLTEADWRLFTTLVRFDPVYVGHFKCNLQRIFDYKNLSNYVRDLYQKEGIADTVNMSHIKEHYYVSHTTINPTKIVPEGPKCDYTAEHNRDSFK